MQFVSCLISVTPINKKAKSFASMMPERQSQIPNHAAMCIIPTQKSLTQYTSCDTPSPIFSEYVLTFNSPLISYLLFYTLIVLNTLNAFSAVLRTTPGIC